MIDFTPSDEQQLLVESVRRFVREEILPLESELDPDAYELLPGDKERLTAKVREMGYYGLDTPEEFGGPGLDATTHSLLVMEMSKHRAGLYAPCYGTFGEPGLVSLYLYDGTEDQKKRYLYPTLSGDMYGFFALSEPSGGSDPARAVRTTARRDGDDWIISGQKLWISGADHADYGLVFARTGSGREGITCFIVDRETPGFDVHRIVHTMRSAHPAAELYFDEARVPDRNRLGEVGRGFALAKDRLTRQRIPYAAGCLGVAAVAHEMALDYAKSRETFGKPLGAHQGIQWMLVDNEIDLRSARLLVLDAAAKVDAQQPFAAEAAIAKIVATEAASRIVDRAIQIHGAFGVCTELPLERWYRELRIRRVGEGPTEIQRLVVARSLLGSIAK